MRTAHDNRYRQRERVTPCEIPRKARLVPINSEAVAARIAELGGREPSAEALYVWRTRGFVVKPNGDCRAIVLPSVMAGGRPMTTMVAVNAWWRAVRAEAKRCGVDEPRT